MSAVAKLNASAVFILSYLITLSLVIGIGVLATILLNRISASVDDLTNNLAVDIGLSKDIVSQTLLVRLYANKYVRTQSQVDEDHFNEEFARLEEILLQADLQITNPERVEMLDRIKLAVEEYGDTFGEVVRLIRKRQRIHSEVLDVQGLMIENKLTALRVHTISLNNPAVFLAYTNAQSAFQVMNSNAIRYLEGGDERYTVQLETGYQQAQAAFSSLETNLQDPAQRKNVISAQAAADAYYDGLQTIRADYVRLMDLFETKLDVLEPEISNTTAEMAASVEREFERQNEISQALISQTRLVMVATTIIALLAGSGIGVVLSRRITERGQAEWTLRRERDLAEALEEATTALIATLDFDQVLDRILEQVNRIVPSDVADIMLIKGDQAQVVRWRGYDRFGIKEHTTTLSFHIPDVPNIQQLIESREPMIIPDVTTYPGWVLISGLEWQRAFASAPIIVREEVIGILNVGSAIPGFFTQTHANALRAFADHAAAAIENARLYEAAQQELTERKRAEQELKQHRDHLEDLVGERTAELTTVNEQFRQEITERKRAQEDAQRRAAQAALAYEVGRRVSGELALDELLSTIVTAVYYAFDYDHVGLLLLDEQAKCLTLEAIAGKHAAIFPEKFQLAIGEGMIGYAAESGKIQISGDVSQEPHYTQKIVDTKSELAVPIKSGQKVIGVLDLQSSKFDAFDGNDAVLMETLANQITIAIKNARLHEETLRLAAFADGIVQTTTDGIVVENAEGYFTFINPATAAMLGYTPDELIGQHWTVIIPPDQQPIVQAADERRTHGETDRYEIKLVRKNGTRFPVLVGGAPRFEEGQFVGTLATFTDITERKQAEDALRKLATEDPLLGCFNRRHFFSLAENELARAVRYQHQLSVIMIDIDYFKQVNDAHGHSVGDEVLIAIAGGFEELLRTTDIFARYGGEEFIILLLEANTNQAQQTAERLRKKAAEPIRIGKLEIFVSISLGVACKSSEDDITIDGLLDRADQALYAAKRAGRNRVMVWPVVK
ncbi:MAG: diguanylate cyclase [Chloroflexi bacterium]|nr:diguanylate cyclase [Chloroflexota bacterium]